MSDERFLRSLVGGDSKEAERPLIFMTLAERRARRFAELWGSEFGDNSLGRWYADVFRPNLTADGDGCLSDTYFDFLPNGGVRLATVGEDGGEVDAMKLFNALFQVLAELPDEWTEEQLAEAEARAGEMMERIDWE